MNSFTPNSKVGKAIILITDGEDNEGGAEEMAKQAQSKGIRVFIFRCWLYRGCNNSNV